jgi:uncharacterized LabA/DUF88 family protein
VYFFTGEASGLKKRIALLIDGGFLDKKIPNKSKNPEIQAGRIVQAALACMDPVEEELYRIYYYHCPPYGRKAMDVAGNLVDFSATPAFAYHTSLLAYLARQEFVAVRLGMLSLNGWIPKSHILYQVKKTGNVICTAADFKPNLQQKGVDMRIGLDVALLALNHLVERVALVTADSDFIPAMKLARREGLQVVLSSLANKTKPELEHHADIYRNPSLAHI